MDRKYKMNDNLLLNDQLLRLDGTQYTTEGQLRTFLRTKGMAKLKPSRYLVAIQQA